MSTYRRLPFHRKKVGDKNKKTTLPSLILSIEETHCTSAMRTKKIMHTWLWFNPNWFILSMRRNNDYKYGYKPNISIFPKKDNNKYNSVSLVFITFPQRTRTKTSNDQLTSQYHLSKFYLLSSFKLHHRTVFIFLFCLPKYIYTISVKTKGLLNT